VFLFTIQFISKPPINMQLWADKKWLQFITILFWTFYANFLTCINQLLQVTSIIYQRNSQRGLRTSISVISPFQVYTYILQSLRFFFAELMFKSLRMCINTRSVFLRFLNSHEAISIMHRHTHISSLHVLLTSLSIIYNSPM